LLLLGIIGAGTALLGTGCARGKSDVPQKSAPADKKEAVDKKTESLKPPGNGAIINGKDFALLIAAPNGWVMDTKAGIPQRLAAVFYPQGQAWDSAETVMYLNAVSKRMTGFKTAEELIERDFKEYRQRNPQVVMEVLPTRRHPDKAPVLLRKYTNPQTQHYDITAYINEETIIAVLSLDAVTPADLATHATDFDKLLDSYVFVTTDVQ
jgi:hypothetical protein